MIHTAVVLFPDSIQSIQDFPPRILSFEREAEAGRKRKGERERENWQIKYLY